ncbi:MAG TPA: hypothetical protein VFV99_04675 [Kofleriaceae bacterium]|nr:hypothetical protein [Kofleriaceae bacterium]
MIADPPVIARVRAQLVDQVQPPLVVSTTSQQYYFDEEHAAYCEIEVKEGEAFAAVVVRGSLPSEEFVVRVWHRYADEVWLVDSVEQVMFVVPREGEIRVFEIGETMRSVRVPDVHIAVATVFGIVN